MQQQNVTIKQLAQTAADFLEPVIPYLVIGSKKADVEASKKAGTDLWAVKKKLWGKLCSGERPGLKEAAGDMVVAPADLEVKQIFIQEILNSLEQDPDLALEISSFMKDEAIQKIIKEDSARLKIQSTNDRSNILKEFYNLLDEFLAKKNNVQDLEQLELSGTGIDFSCLGPEANISIRRVRKQYIHIQLNQGIRTEETPSAKRMAQIAEMNVIGQSDAQRFQSRLSVLYQLEDPLKDEFMEKAIDFASRIKYGDLRSQALSLLVPYLEGPGRTELIEKTLFSASSIQDEGERSLVLSSLLPHLRGPGKERLIENIFSSASDIQYSDAKFQILSSVVPHLYGSKNERIMGKALELADGILSEYLRVQALSLLVPYLDGEGKEEIIEEALQLAFNLKDKDRRPEALSFIILHLDEARKKEILEKAFEMATGIQTEYRRKQALSSLDLYLDESR